MSNKKLLRAFVIFIGLAGVGIVYTFAISMYLIGQAINF